jgi:hypothetical protein
MNVYVPRIPLFFSTKDAALKHMTVLNRMQNREVFCVVDGRKDFLIIDLKTATDMGLPYECSVKESDRSKYRSFQSRRKLFGLINW